MLDRILPGLIMKALLNYNINDIYELRIRRNSPVVINLRGKNIVLTKDGKMLGEKIYATTQMVEYIVKQATENSLYAYNNQVKQGFITAVGGIRVGIAGESVNSDNFMPTTIKNINSLNIRIPHEVKGCSNVAFKFIYNEEKGIRNTLVISPPGAGKTTLLRDIARKLSEVDRIYNTLVVDERFELASTIDGCPMLDIGEFSDVVSGAGKMFAFTNGVRSLKPDVIITDELIGEEDLKACEQAMRSGVKVVASVHGDNCRDVCERKEFKDLMSRSCFERYVVLSDKRGSGTCEGIFDKDLKCIYF